MEQNSLTFDIISTDDVLIQEVIDFYNSTYNTDFKITKFIYEEVTFAEIIVTKYKMSDIFDLGYQFGIYVQHKRNKGEIDW